MDRTIRDLENEILVQKDIAFTAGILQGDITLKTLFESIAEAVIVVNKIGRIVMVNHRFEVLFGYSKKELMGEPMEILLRSEFRKKHGKHLGHFFMDPTVRSMGGGFDLVGLSKSNTEIPIEISLSHLTTTAGTLGLAFISDITERKKAEKDMLAKNEALDAYAHTIAHDLRSSLNTIMGFSQLLVEDKSIPPKEQDELLNYIHNGGNKMNEIIEAILFMAKVDKADVKREIIDMEVLINNVLERLSSKIKKREANVKIHKNKDIEHGFGYGPWIEEVVYNLIGNAIKHGGDKPQVDISCEMQDEYIRYCIKNSGTPLSKKKITELNHTIASIKTDTASGFGLAIVHRILQKLDGKLKIESSAKEGNIFSFYLPIKNLNAI